MLNRTPGITLLIFSGQCNGFILVHLKAVEVSVKHLSEKVAALKLNHTLATTGTYNSDSDIILPPTELSLTE